MVKILLGLVAAVVIAVGGFFGFEFYTQHRITREVEAAFEQIRAGGGKASHGKVSFDLKSRTLKIDEIATESASQPPVSVKIARVVASGVGQPDTGRFWADSIEATDIEVGTSMAGPADAKLAYKMPRLMMKDYSGLASLKDPPASASTVGIYRSGLEQFSAMSAASVSAPSIAVTINFGAATSGEFVHSGLALRDIKGGKIAAMQIERASFTINTQHAGKPDKMTGEIANLASSDFDAGAIAAILDPQKANDDRYIRVYSKMTAGPYTVTSAQGLRMRIDAMTVDDVAVRPSRLQLPAMLATIQVAGTAQPSPAQARDLIEQAAALYEGVRVGTAEMHGLSAETPQGPFKLSAIRFNLEGGKVGEFAFEGFDTRTPKGPIKLGRFALKSLDVANFMRLSAQLANPSQPPSPELIAALFPLIQGVEIKGVMAPFKNTGKFVNLDGFDLNWGQFVGPIPSKARLTAKMTTPVDATDPAMKPLIAAGLDTLSADGDIGAEWTEAARSFVVEVPKFEIGGLLKASARIALANVPRQVFSANAAQAIGAAAQIEAGTIELTLRDLGSVDVGVVQYARAQNVSREAARQVIVESIRASSQDAATANPDAADAVQALARFVETPGQTLVIKLTPLGKVSAIQLVQLLKTDPMIALAQFRIEASTGL
ncbi:hypothetical protein [Bradyrhizobium australiense]|uniref:Uncharacterized protein n=1 Tax=Bradyrhizobium australiense TaxID=2721161 RepID=A0A7Y4LVY1_9BRAD|nr:hypothetical protein [Bradyrhizobium australiense]NOJ40651.1 hypothetical protein [Bradyrhizobium australiense]